MDVCYVKNGSQDSSDVQVRYDSNSVRRNRKHTIWPRSKLVAAPKWRNKQPLMIPWLSNESQVISRWSPGVGYLLNTFVSMSKALSRAIERKAMERNQERRFIIETVLHVLTGFQRDVAITTCNVPVMVGFQWNQPESSICFTSRFYCDGLLTGNTKHPFHLHFPS